MDWKHLPLSPFYYTSRCLCVLLKIRTVRTMQINAELRYYSGAATSTPRTAPHLKPPKKWSRSHSILQYLWLPSSTALQQTADSHVFFLVPITESRLSPPTTMGLNSDCRTRLWMTSCSAPSPYIHQSLWRTFDCFYSFPAPYWKPTATCHADLASYGLFHPCNSTTHFRWVAYILPYSNESSKYSQDRTARQTDGQTDRQG